MYTPNYGSLDDPKYHNFGFNVCNMIFGGFTYSDMVKNGIWFVKEFHLYHGNYDGTMGLIDNYGSLWTAKVGSQTISSYGSKIHFTRDKEGFAQMPDEVIDTIQKIDLKIDVAPTYLYPIIMRWAQPAMELVQLKNEHSKIKDIVEKLTTENAELKQNVTDLSNKNDELMDNVEKLTTENAELKQNVTDLSNENDKLMDIIHKNRWLIVF